VTGLATFESVQTIIRYKICKLLIDAYSKNKNLIMIDETYAEFSIFGSRSYTPRGTRPHRADLVRSQKLSIIIGRVKSIVHVKN